MGWSGSAEWGAMAVVGQGLSHANESLSSSSGSPRPPLGPARLAMERLGTLLLVPELSLVVGASMSGRVALVTLTRPEPANDVLGLKRGFKIEAILPTEQDEDKNMRPLCPLYGVAVGPLPQTPRGKMAGQNRYRRKPTSSSCL